MIDPADLAHVRTVIHELGHALVGRSLGWPVRTVVTTPSAHNTSGWCEHYPRTSLSPLELAADEITVYLAGEIAGHMVPLDGFLEDVDGCAERAEQTAHAALERLPVDEASFVAYVQTDTRLTTGDLQRADSIAKEAAGEEFALFLAFCAARARRLVAANVPLIEVLLPVALASPILSGDDVERAIEAARQPEALTIPEEPA
jgi:hypothetical protein